MSAVAIVGPEYCPGCHRAMLTGAPLPGSASVVCLDCYQGITGHAPLPNEIERLGGVFEERHAAVRMAPSICTTPSPPSPIPIPYPNQVLSARATNQTSVKSGGNVSLGVGAKVGTSTGDEPGTLKGLASSTNVGKTSFVMYTEIKIEKASPVVGNPLFHNRRP